MNDGTRYFVLLDDKIQQIGIERLSQLYHGLVPEYAGLKLPYALLLFELKDHKLEDLRYWRGSYLVFDDNGKADETSGRNIIELSLTGERDPKSFLARRADQIRRENTWHPTGEQPNQMIKPARKDGYLNLDSA